MLILDNINRTVRDELYQSVRQGSKLSVAAACFSIYAYQELKKQLENIEELRFIFTSPTFTTERTPKAKREFYIPRLNRERSLYGTEFEVRLRNELTQKAIAKECADWIRRKVRFKSNVTQEQMMGFMTVDESTYMPINGFTTVDLGCERGNHIYYPVTKTESFENAGYFIRLFNELWNDKKRFQDVTDIVVEGISTAYRENSPEFIYFFTLYNLFSEFLDDISEDVLPKEATGFQQSRIWELLYDFQKDAALAIIHKLETYNGCILADSVGLGKTFTALAVIKYYEMRNRNVLVLCPKKLAENWIIYKSNYDNNPIYADRLRYDVLYHTDLTRERGESNGLDLEHINWGNYDLVVIDESHNFRNGGELSGEEGRENRYLRLMNRVIRAGVPTKVLMLSATPVNNRFTDLRNQLRLAYEGDAERINDKLKTAKNIDEVFRAAQKSFNLWSKLPAEGRSTEALLRTLDFDFFEVLDSVTIARSRRHIEKYYNTERIGRFPERLKPISLTPELTDLGGAITYQEIFGILEELNLQIYTPSAYIHPSRLEKYETLSTRRERRGGISQQGREQGIRRLMSVNLLKRLESSVCSFRLTVQRVRDYVRDTIRKIDGYRDGQLSLDMPELSADFDFDDLNTDWFSVGKKVRIDLSDLDYVTWRRALAADLECLELLLSLIGDIQPEHDTKLQALFALIRQKAEQPINEGNRRILIFTAFSDTADYLFEQVSAFAKKNFGMETGEVTGTVDGRTTLAKRGEKLNTVLTWFSPVSKGRKAGDTHDLDILIATDCISEGQNLQDCDFCVNYDIHWNPVRIIQRFGRVDRIGSRNAVIQLVNFWPNMDLDEYINLRGRVEDRMKMTVLTSTGDDNPIAPEEKGDLEYRRAQLKRLRTEVVDLEEMTGGISITDLGLNEFRLDLLEYRKQHDDVEESPFGMSAVVPAGEDAPPGVIFVLKNINDSVNSDDRNRIHPFYMVYIREDGEVVCDYLKPKAMLDKLRLLCRGKSEPFLPLCRAFNAETDDGRNMKAVSELLSEAINSIVDTKEESDIDSLFKPGGTSALLSDVSGLDDFELICFLVVRQAE